MARTKAQPEVIDSMSGEANCVRAPQTRAEFWYEERSTPKAWRTARRSRPLRTNLPLPTLRAPMYELLRRILVDGHLVHGWWRATTKQACPSCDCQLSIVYYRVDDAQDGRHNYAVTECFLCGATVHTVDLYPEGLSL